MTRKSQKDTEARLFALVRDHDVRRRSRTTARRLSRDEFEQKCLEIQRKSATTMQESAGDQQESAEGPRKKAPRRTSAVVADELGVSVSFVERSRFIIDHGTPNILKALEAGQITHHRAWRLSEMERRRVRSGGPALPEKTVGQLLVAMAAPEGSLYGGRWNNAQRDLAADIANHLYKEGHLSKEERYSILSCCSRLHFNER